MKGYQITISQEREGAEWDAFLADTPGGHHVQTSCWARVKSTIGWRATRIFARDGGQIVGGAQILTRNVPIFGGVGYVPSGPLLRRSDSVLARLLLDRLKDVCRENRCQLLAIQPPSNGGELVGMLEASKFAVSRLNLGPTASLLLDLQPGPDAILANMERKTRQHVLQSERAGVTVREGTGADLALFYGFYLATARRQGFTPYRRAYFDALWQALAPRGWIALLVACHEGEAVSSQLLVPFGDTVLCKMIGWSGEHSSRRPNHALYWASLLWSIKHGYRYFDFGGVNPEGAREVLNGRRFSEVTGVSQDIIKYGYGGKVVIYPPPYDFFANRPLNWLYHNLSSAITEDSLPYRLMEHMRKR